MWHKQSFTQFWSQSDAYSRRSSLKLTYIHHPLVVCTHQICCAVAVPIALSQDRLLHGHNRLVNWTPCSRMREQAKKLSNHFHRIFLQDESPAHSKAHCFIDDDLIKLNTKIWLPSLLKYNVEILFFSSNYHLNNGMHHQSYMFHRF